MKAFARRKFTIHESISLRKRKNHIIPIQYYSQSTSISSSREGKRIRIQVNGSLGFLIEWLCRRHLSVLLFIFFLSFFFCLIRAANDGASDGALAQWQRPSVFEIPNIFKSSQGAGSCTSWREMKKKNR